MAKEEEILISLAMFCLFALGIIFGNLYGRGMEWASYKKLRKSWEKEIEYWRILYLTSERQRQEFINEYCEKKNWPKPDFNSELQNEIDFNEDSPVLTEKE